MDELQRVRLDVQSRVDGGGDIAVTNPLKPDEKLALKTRMQKQAWTLRPLASTGDRRQALTRLMTASEDDALNDAENYAEGVFGRNDSILGPAFQEELKKVEPGKRPEALVQYVKKLDPARRREAVGQQLQADLQQAFAEPGEKKETEEQRQAIAHLLLSAVELSLDQETEPGKTRNLIGNQAYRRSLAVVGLEAAIREMDRQSVVFDDLSRQIASGMVRDRSDFAEAHRRLLLLIHAASDELQELKVERDRERDKTKDQQDVVSVREQEVKELKKKLQERQKLTSEKLAEQTRKEQQLFQSQREFRDAVGENFRLEGEVRKLEKGR
jgi:hypothetical protein